MATTKKKAKSAARKPSKTVNKKVAKAKAAPKKAAAKKGRKLAFVAHVCGTAKDPQGLGEQEEKLESEGVLVFPTNALASRAAGYIASGGKTPAVKRNKGENI